MIKFTDFLEEYAFKVYSIYSKVIPENEWGNKQMAFDYLQKYYLPEEDYFKTWQPIQNLIFQNQNVGLPSILFNAKFSLLAIRGGVLFEKEDFENLKSCMKELGDKNLILVQNNFGGVIKRPLFRMKYPVNISWDELMGGNYISAAIFETCINEYFVFSESGQWGKYSANDYVNPLDILGFKPEIASIFKKYFIQPYEEQMEIREWLPPVYRRLISVESSKSE